MIFDDFCYYFYLIIRQFVAYHESDIGLFPFDPHPLNASVWGNAAMKWWSNYSQLYE